MDTTNLLHPPSSSFWLNELRFPRFPDLSALLDDPAALQRELADAFAGSGSEKFLREILVESGDSSALRLHLLLVAAFLEKKKSTAIRDVALACYVFPAAQNQA
jgi:hypothetical protein